MANVYSLICWGGLNGKAVSVAVSGSVATLTNHGLRTGMGVVPQSTTNGLTSSVTVYARYLTATTFSLHTSSAGAISNTGLVTISGAIASVTANFVNKWDDRLTLGYS